MGLQLVTPASVYPVTLADVKDHLSILDNSSDARLTTYISDAVDTIERETGLSLCSQTWCDLFAMFPRSGAILTTKQPVQSITTFTYYDQTNTLQSLVQGTDYYAALFYSHPAELFPKTTNSSWLPAWPGEYLWRPDCIAITYVTGWSGSGSSWIGPQAAVKAIKVLCSYWDSGTRGDVNEDLPPGFERLLGLLRSGFYA